MNKLIKKACEVIDIEIAGLEQVKEQLDQDFINLVEKSKEILSKGGKLVISGVGKSGHIGKKIAATLASTGARSVFVHPVEALHGDLGVLESKDLFIGLSYSGESDELLAILPAVKRFGTPIAAITASENSALGEYSDIVVKIEVEKEACPFGLAPTTSAVATLAMGDALAMVLMDEHKFTQEDYGMFHPGGAIGRAVTLRVSDIMRSDDKLAKVNLDTTVKDVLLSMTKAKCGAAIIVDENNNLKGIFTDGDFRRCIESDLNILGKNIKDVMTINPTAVYAEDLVVSVLKIVESKNINDIIVLDKSEKVVGLIDIQDLPKLKLM